MDALWTLLTKKVADEVGKTVDHVNQVDEVHAHSDEITPSRANDVDNANQTPSTDTKIAPTAANNVEYPEGISYRQDLPKHLQTFDGIGKNGVGGTHSLDAFDQIVADNGIKIVNKIEHPKVKGIYSIEYKLPKLDKQLRPTGDLRKPTFKKTVYDPAIHSDEKILQLGQEAAAKGLDDAIAKNEYQYTQTAGGIEFRVFVDLKTKEVRNVFPQFERNGN